VWHGGWAARLLAATLVIELVYDTFLDIVFLKGVIDIALKRNARWGNEARPAGAKHVAQKSHHLDQGVES